MAAIDVACQHDGQVHRMREAHVRNVVRAQIGFGGTARALDDRPLAFSGEPAIGLDRDAQQVPLVAAMILGIEHANALTLHDQLRTDVALRLQQHRIHVGSRCDPAGHGLERGRAADLAAVDGDGRVVRHVLRLERPDAMAAVREQTAQAGDEHGLAHVGTATLDHECWHIPPVGEPRPKKRTTVPSRSPGSRLALAPPSQAARAQWCPARIVRLQLRGQPGRLTRFPFNPTTVGTRHGPRMLKPSPSVNA